MRPRFEPAPVRVRRGPVHIAVPVLHGWSTACGKRLRGAQLCEPEDWEDGYRCPGCDEIADAATSLELLAMIAGW